MELYSSTIRCWSDVPEFYSKSTCIHLEFQGTDLPGPSVGKLLCLPGFRHVPLNEEHGILNLLSPAATRT